MFNAHRSSVARLGRPAMLTLIACGAILASALLAACSPTFNIQTPTAQTIINKAKHATWKDATFTFTSAATTAGLTYHATGHGVETTKPQRSDETVTSVAGSQSQTEEIITDGQTIYTRQQGQPKWTKTTIPPNFGGVSPTSPTDFGSLQNLTFVGSETIEGYPTWHVKGMFTTTAQGKTTTNNVDLWVRQDNFYVVQVKDHTTVTGQSGAVDTTLLFTKWNTGVVITPPPPSQVTTS
ncbi:MAG TPA: hypothetical protein VKQ36_14595 [Ktedonobacterales bacterium]|nr:hypothetical protein [Ktedonobacterales bacterium]